MASSGYGTNATPGDQDAGVMYCAKHPTVPTYLRCGRCDKPICPRCRVHTSVGYRCLDCANISVLPTYKVEANYYMRAVAAGIGFATLVGLIWGFLPGFDFWALLVLGIGTAEVVGAASNQKRGPGLQAIGIVGVIWGIVVSRLALVYMAASLPQVFDFVKQIPGNDSAPILHGSLTIAALFSSSDLIGIVFMLMAAGLVYVRLR